MPTITAENIKHIYSIGTPFESVALQDVNVTIEQGEFVGIIGHTGSGKSTFVQHLNGLLEPRSGKLLHDGMDINKNKKYRYNARFKVGLVFQYPEYQLFEDTVYRDIAFGPKNMHLSKSEINERVHEAADFVGVPEELFDKSPLELSGGQKRRVAIAGVIAMRPEVLVLDEPTAGLDPKGCEEILDNISKYRNAKGATVIIVSHSMEDIARIANRLIVFDGGNITMDGTPAEIFSRAEELRSIGLDVPTVTEIAEQLRILGIDIPNFCYTIDHLENALLSIYRGDSNA